MERVTISLEGPLLQQFDEFVRRKGYRTRSEAVRDIVRDRLEVDRVTAHAAPFCVASVSYVYSHHERELARRITQIHHAHHDLIRSTVHVHLDHENCLEVALLEGATDRVQGLADALCAETGIRHGQVNLVPADVTVAHTHAHEPEPEGAPTAPADAPHARPHLHVSPKT
jgi:CopG family transcriptional regulator, nickel-responsive regulator